VNKRIAAVLVAVGCSALLWSGDLLAVPLDLRTPTASPKTDIRIAISVRSWETT